MMDYSYATQMVPAAADIGNKGADCCSGGSAGAAAASTAQDWRPQFATGGSGPTKIGMRAAAPGRSCKCWWVALGAVVVIALVARA
jgi:hypothetical protein